jgi:DNA-binding transcriptional LysR family regulator
MNRNHLALFQAVADAGSISGGAERLRISQPAVSKQIGELEGALEVRLLDRLPRGIRLTEAGRLLALYARKMKILENDAELAIDELRGLKRGKLEIGASTTIGGYLLPKALIRFHQAYPGVEVNLRIGNTTVIQNALLEGRLEIGFTEGGSTPAELESSVFEKDELVAIAHAGHVLVSRKRVGIKTLCREPFIFRESGSGTREVVEAALSRKGIFLKPILSLGGTEAIKRAVIARVGVAIVSRLTIGVELDAGLLGIVPLTNLKLRRPLHQEQLRGRSLSSSVKEFLRILKSGV